MLFLPSLFIKKDKLLIKNRLINFFDWQYHQKIYIDIILLQINQFCIKPINNNTDIQYLTLSIYK